jgi:TPR repeat protein
MGKLPEEAWRDYLLGAPRYQIRVAVWAKRSTGLQLWFDRAFARTAGDPPAAEVIALIEDDLSGIPRQAKGQVRREKMNLSSASAWGRGDTEDLKQARYSALEPGRQTYHYRYVLQAIDREAGEKVLGERVVEGSIDWQLLAADAPPPLPALLTDPEMHDAVAHSFNPPHLLRAERDKTLVRVMLQVDKPLTNLGFDLSLSANGELWPLGPVGWAKGKIGSWAFDVDLPEEIVQADFVLRPSAQAAATCARDWHHQMMDVHEIWDGPEIVIPAVRIQEQKIEMLQIEPPAQDAAREYALTQMDPADPVTQQLQREGNPANAQALLEERCKTHPEDASARLELGAVLTAEGKWVDAMQRFVEAGQLHTSPDLSRRIRREERRLCALWLHEVNRDKLEGMAALGRAYEQGWGVAVDLQEAKRWYRNASNAGDANAMCRLAAMYEHRAGATTDAETSDVWYQEQALEWYRKSASLGNKEAKLWITARSH